MKPRPRLLVVPRESRPPARTILTKTTVTVPTIRTVRAKARLIDRRRRVAEKIVAAMRDRGATLQLNFQNGTAVWRLSTGGPRISPDVANFVVGNPSIVGVGDSLFPNTPSQTWRWCE